jgi:hypothetical protein
MRAEILEDVVFAAFDEALRAAAATEGLVLVPGP